MFLEISHPAADLGWIIARPTFTVLLKDGRSSNRLNQGLTTIVSGIWKSVQAQIWFRIKAHADKILHFSASN